MIHSKNLGDPLDIPQIDVYTSIMADESFNMLRCLETGQLCACGNLRKASRAVTQYYDEILRPSGLRATQLALLVTIRGQGAMTVKELAESTLTDRTTLTRNLRPIDKQKLIRIEPGEDRRERIVTLTEQGRKTLAAALPLWKRAQNRVTKDLGQARFRRLLSDLSAMVEVVQPD